MPASGMSRHERPSAGYTGKQTSLAAFEIRQSLCPAQGDTDSPPCQAHAQPTCPGGTASMTNPADRSAIAQLKSRLRTVMSLNRAAAVLGWDQQTYMPPNGVAARA